MASMDLNFRTKARRPPAAVSQTPRLSFREAGQASGLRAARPHICRLNAGQLVRSACLVLLCFGVSCLPRVHKAPPQGSVAAAVNQKA
jgi:hypothetical protein